jgi:spermidine/putrescine transport system substrate-binding protein
MAKELSVNEVLDKLQAGKMNRRQFTKALAAFGIGLMASPLLPGMARAAAADQPTHFTWGGWGDPQYYEEYIKNNGEPPNFATFGGTGEAFAKMRSGFVVDTVHPCSSEVNRWVSSGMFQPIDTSQLSNWPDIIPQLWNNSTNVIENGNPYFAPFDWGQTSFIYRTDLVDLQGKPESWELLWDERYKKKLGTFSSAGEAWWCAAILAGIPFEEIGTKANLKKVAALLRKQRPLIKTYLGNAADVEQALASGEVVAAMAWNGSVKTLTDQDVPVRFAAPKEGALTWVCGFMMHKKAPKPKKALELIDSLLGVTRGIQLIKDEGYGHSNRKAIEAVDDKTLAAVGLTRDPMETLGAGKFQIPAGEKFDHDSAKMYTEIQAGF